MEPQREKKTALFVVLLLLFGAMMCCGGTVAFGAWSAKNKLEQITADAPDDDQAEAALPDQQEDADAEDPVGDERADCVDEVLTEAEAQGRDLHVDPGEDDEASADDVFADENGPIPGSPTVDAACQQWNTLEVDARPAMLTALVESFFDLPVPTDWTTARGHLVSTVRPRIVVELSALKSGGALVHAPLADDLEELVAYREGTHLQLVTDADAKPWGQGREALFAEARANLAAATPSSQFKKVSPGLWESTFGDGNDVGRLLLPERLKRAGLKGDPVVLPVLPGTVLIFGSGDARVLEAAGNRVDELADDSAGSTRRGWQLDPRTGTYAPWEAPAGSLLATMADETESARSNLQKDTIDRGSTRYADEDLFVASALAIETADGDVKTYAVWTKGVTTLLPKVDYVLLVEIDGENSTTTRAAAPWDAVQKTVGAQMKPERDLWPMRWRVKTFPSAKNLERLGIDPLFDVDE